MASPVGAQARRRGQARAIVNIRTESYGGLAPGGDKDWRKERNKQLEAEIKALEKQLADFDANEAAEKVRKALDIELRDKKLEVERNKLRLEG